MPGIQWSIKSNLKIRRLNQFQRPPLTVLKLLYVDTTYVNKVVSEIGDRTYVKLVKIRKTHIWYWFESPQLHRVVQDPIGVSDGQEAQGTTDISVDFKEILILKIFLICFTVFMLRSANKVLDDMLLTKVIKLSSSWLSVIHKMAKIHRCQALIQRHF